MKNLLLFWRTVLEELGTWCSVSTTADWKTINSRFESEGDEFLTITLPEFAKDFERSLAQEQVTPDLFRFYKKRQNLPLFLGGFMELIFDRTTGRMLDVEDESPFVIDAIFAVRQLTLMFGKIEKACTPAREQAAFDQYIKTEEELRQWEDGVEGSDLESFRHIAKVLFRDVFVALDSDVYYHKLVPKHGPGSTADRLSGNQKYDISEWTERLESVFPYGEYAIPSWRSYYLLDSAQFLLPGEERPVRVVSVPKTQKTPRIIAIEPTCMQFMQQAVSQRLAYYLATDSTVAGMIGFDDQPVNQQLAQRGSLSGSLATLDLSEASDRVSYLLVSEMLENFHNLHDAVEATRSLTADVPGYGVVPLTKFASMGSALTFPIEAMVFLTCVFHGIASQLSVPVTQKLISELSGNVRVYGDDLIVPVEFATSVVRSLELFGFKVNDRKSFWTGMFRESCGKEYFRGEDVSISRVRRDFPSSRADVQEVISTVSLRNQLFFAGLLKSSRYLDGIIGEVLPHYPMVHPDSPLVGRHSYLSYDSDRMHDTLQSPLVKGYVVNSKIPSSYCSGEGALLKCFLKDGVEPFQDKKHLERQGRPDVVRLKLRWAQPF
jgi:hypothetical protein